MKKIFYSILLISLFTVKLSLACNGDCMMCHTNIPKDTNHDQIQSCINCHKNHKVDAVNQCGADCFDCHSYDKVMKKRKEHKVIERCSLCHINLRGKSLEGLPFIMDNNFKNFFIPKLMYNKPYEGNR